MKLRHKLAVLALMVPVLAVAQRSPAQAYLSQCYAYAPTNSMGESVCNGVVANGGLNQQRVIVQCGRGAPNAYYAFYGGPWVGRNFPSRRSCSGIILPNGYPADGNVYSVDYQLR